MTRPITLFTGQWADLPFEEVARLAGDPALRARLGTAGRARLASRFGWDTTAARFEAAYDRALAFKSLTR